MKDTLFKAGVITFGFLLIAFSANAQAEKRYDGRLSENGTHNKVKSYLQDLGDSSLGATIEQNYGDANWVVVKSAYPSGKKRKWRVAKFDGRSSENVQAIANLKLALNDKQKDSIKEVDVSGPHNYCFIYYLSK